MTPNPTLTGGEIDRSIFLFLQGLCKKREGETLLAVLAKHQKTLNSQGYDTFCFLLAAEEWRRGDKIRTAVQGHQLIMLGPLFFPQSMVLPQAEAGIP